MNPDMAHVREQSDVAADAPKNYQITINNKGEKHKNYQIFRKLCKYNSN